MWCLLLLNLKSSFCSTSPLKDGDPGGTSGGPEATQVWLFHRRNFNFGDPGGKNGGPEGHPLKSNMMIKARKYLRCDRKGGRLLGVFSVPAIDPLDVNSRTDTKQIEFGWQE